MNRRLSSRVAASVAIVVLILGCKPNQTGDGYTRGAVINCAAASVRENWPQAYPAVMNCLVAILVAPMVCLDAIPVATAVGIDTVACIVRGVHVAASMGDAPTDAVSVRKAERSREWLERTGFRFEGEP